MTIFFITVSKRDVFDEGIFGVVRGVVIELVLVGCSAENVPISDGDDSDDVSGSDGSGIYVGGTVAGSDGSGSDVGGAVAGSDGSGSDVGGAGFGNGDDVDATISVIADAILGNTISSKAILGNKIPAVSSLLELGDRASWTFLMWRSRFDFFKNVLLQMLQVLLSRAAFLLLFTTLHDFKCFVMLYLYFDEIVQFSVGHV